MLRRDSSSTVSTNSRLPRLGAGLRLIDALQEDEADAYGSPWATSDALGTVGSNSDLSGDVFADARSTYVSW